MPQTNYLSYDHFGGRAAGTTGNRPEESAIAAWASSQGFFSLQAQTFLVTKLPTLFPKTSLKTLSLKRSLYANDVNAYNKELPPRHAKRITAFVMLINPMHLLVQHAFYKSQVYTMQLVSKGSMISKRHLQSSDLESGFGAGS